MIDRLNLGWLFYKGYFKDIIYDDFKEENETEKEFEERMRIKYKDELEKLDKKDKDYKIKEYKILYKNETSIKKIISKLTEDKKEKKKYYLSLSKSLNLGNTSFELITTYPGLLLGSGYLHELPDVKGQAILGFDFDYTTGLPVIRGSSIKGVLRSAFEHKEYVKDCIKNLLNKVFDDKDLEKLEIEIFENSDIFLDAYIIDFKETLLSDDYITPHKDEVKNPIPLRFIKVSPNVTFRFEFRLNDFRLNGTILTKEKKKELFKSIILDLGLGAKTNVGYGKFIENVHHSA